MEDVKRYDKCDLCKTLYPQKPHIYEVKRLSRYEMNVCNKCCRANWDGVAPTLEQNFVEHLKSKNIPLPARNSKGWYPLE